MDDQITSNLSTNTTLSKCNENNTVCVTGTFSTLNDKDIKHKAISGELTACTKSGETCVSLGGTIDNDKKGSVGITLKSAL